MAESNWRQPELKVVRWSKNASLPTKGSSMSAGHDLYSAQDVIVPARGKRLISTDIEIILPPGSYGRIAIRSGLALHHHLSVQAGVIDPDYDGIIRVLLFNHSNQDFFIYKGDRIAQIICEQARFPKVIEMAQSPRDPISERGSKGFGSTGR